MATRTIQEGFRVFHSRLTPGSYESGKASSHKSSIESCLKNSFDLKQLFYSGSAKNGTSISRHSDVDFFASIPGEKLKADSSSALREIKECLQKRFPKTDIFVDFPAVVLNFGSEDWDKAEVIPAEFLELKNSQNVYEIPDVNGTWRKSSPSTHISYTASENNRLSKKLKPLIRFIKAWKYYCNVPIYSFYLELRATKWMENEDSIIYDIDLNSIFRKLHECELADMIDPKRVSGFVKACPSFSKKDEALSKVNTAKIRAQKARDAKESNNIKEAFEWWDKVFAGNFPSYYY